MKAINWEAVSEGSGGFADLPSGGYVCKIVEVIDEDDYTNNWGDTYDRIVIRYDVAEGPEVGFFERNNKPDFTHEHEFRYNPANCGEKFTWSVEQFKRLWNTILPDSNPGWAWDFNPASFKGIKFGATLRHRYYTKNDGEEGSQIQIQGFYTAQAIRDGKFKAPQDIDKRDKSAKPAAASPAPAAYDTSDVPFL